MSANEEIRLTSEKDRGIYGYFWLSGNRLAYVKDEGGDENIHIFAVNSDGTNEIDLTPFENIKAEIIDVFAVNPAWTITRIGLAQAGKRMNHYMEEFDKVVIQIPEDPNHLFEYMWGEFSLKGYKAAKTKAEEICYDNSVSYVVLKN